jgi:excisionase family DNA binding protein
MVFDGYFGTQEAARILGYSRQHLGLLIRRRHIEAYRIGRDWIIPQEAVEKYLAQRGSLSLFGNAGHGRPSKGVSREGTRGA